MYFFVDFSCYKMCFYNSLFCNLIRNTGGKKKNRSSSFQKSSWSSSSSSSALPAFASLLAPPLAPEKNIQWICPDLAQLQGSGPAASLTKYLREGLALLPNLAPVKDQYSGKSLRKGDFLSLSSISF